MRRQHASRAKLLQKQLRDARKEKGLTQVNLAERLGIAQDLVSKYETGERRLDVIELLDVLDALHVDWIEFIRDIRRKP